jgi:hypothetical protein
MLTAITEADRQPANTLGAPGPSHSGTGVRTNYSGCPILAALLFF